MTEIHERIAALEAQLAELKAEVTPEVEVVSSRRDVFKKLALGAAGVAVGGAVLAKATPAAAADNGTVLMGTTNTFGDTGATNTTLKYVSGTAPTTATLFAGTQPTNAFLVRHGSSGLELLGADSSSYPAMVAGYAANVIPNGLYGFSSSATSHGVVGLSSNGVGVLARGATRANLALHAEGDPGPARAVAHAVGEVVCDGNGDLWFCTVAGNPGTWRKMSGATTAGQLHILEAPVRVYDSRTGAGPASTGDGPLGAGAERAVSLANGFVAAVATPAVPAGATAALVTLTVANTTGSGFLGVFSNALATWPGTSNINWSSAGQAIATTTVSGVDADAKVRLHSGGSVVGTDFLIDVIGYYQ